MVNPFQCTVNINFQYAAIKSISKSRLEMKIGLIAGLNDKSDALIKLLSLKYHCNFRYLKL